jgi:hypothetical protein
MADLVAGKVPYETAVLTFPWGFQFWRTLLLLVRVGVDTPRRSFSGGIALFV